jgi:hypothetical protein
MRIKHQWLLCVVSGLWLGTQVQADTTAVGPDAFPASATVLSLNGLAYGTEVNGLTVNGVRFSYAVGASPLNGAVQIDEGPGATNHIAPPNIPSVDDNTGALTVILPNAMNLFGYGFAIFSEHEIADATTIAALAAGCRSVRFRLLARRSHSLLAVSPAFRARPPLTDWTSRSTRRQHRFSRWTI